MFTKIWALQIYVVKVMRENAHEAAYIQRTFEEFQELHNKLRLLFPSSLLPRYVLRLLSALRGSGEGSRGLGSTALGSQDLRPRFS